MSRLKIEHGVSKSERVKLQVSVDQPVAGDIELMAMWSNNEKNYIVNELLRFALAQSADFQAYKQSRAGTAKQPGTMKVSHEPGSEGTTQAAAVRSVEASR